MHVREHVAEAFHLAASNANDLAHAGIVGGNPAHGEVLLLEHSFKSGTLPPSCRVRVVATVAVLVIEFAPCRLLRIQPQFGIALTPLGLASSEQDEGKCNQGQEARHKNSGS